MASEHGIKIWLIGNTGLRNPQRIAEGFALYAESPFVGQLIDGKNDRAFTRYLHEHGIINNEAGKDASGSHARKWRLMFEKIGLIYRKIGSKVGSQSEFGPVGHITPFGRSFLQADSYAAQQECFLRALSIEQITASDGSSLFSPLRWILAIMLELEHRTGSSEISRTEFALWGHTTDPTYDLGVVVDNILDLRERREAAASKRVFDKHEKAERGTFYDKKPDNFFDYCDMNMRYLRITGVIQRKGRGLILAPTKRVLAEMLAKPTVGDKTLFEAYQTLAHGAPLPCDEIEVAKRMLRNVETMANNRHVYYDIDDITLDSPMNVNLARLRIEELLMLREEALYAEHQRVEWQEIVSYMSLIERGGGTYEAEDTEKSVNVPKDETPAYLEWVLWRALLALDHLLNEPYEVRGFKIDSDFLPVSTAGAGRADLFCDFDDFCLIVEASMSTSSRQEAMEGEPVRRHVSDAMDRTVKPVLGLFVATKIDTNTAETFRHGIWYDKDDNLRRLNIVPLTLGQFRDFFEALFASNSTQPVQLKNLIELCVSKRDALTGPSWKDFIQNAVYAWIQEATHRDYEIIDVPG